MIEKVKVMFQRIFEKKHQTILFFFLFANVVGLLNTFVVITSQLAEGEKINVVKYFIYEFSGVYSFFLLIPLMLLLFKKLPVRKNNLTTIIPIYVLTAAVLGLIHTCIMYFSRILIFQMAGWGTYDYGYLPYRYVMETLKLSLGGLTVYLIYIFIVSNREKQKEKLKAVKLEEQLSKTRLEFLKSQIHPHFLFNTLNMISSTMYDNVESADKMLADLSDLLRISLKDSKDGRITLKKEIEILELYTGIMKARFKDKLEINLSINSNTEEALVPSFILQPLVENSIKYGMETLSSLKVEITSNKNKDKLILEICDNGPGIKEIPDNILKNGLGMSNTIERLEKLYDKNFEFNWGNCSPHGFQINIVIPFQNGKTNHG